MSTFKIPYLMWGGGKAIGKPEIKDRLVGVARYKLESSPKVGLQLTALRNKPTYEGVDSVAFLSYSEAQGLTNRVGSTDICYIELSKLADIAEEVRE